MFLIAYICVKNEATSRRELTMDQEERFMAESIEA